MNTTIRFMFIGVTVAILVAMTTFNVIALTPPVGLWSFEEGSGAVTHDSVGGLDATISGAAWTTGLIGSALEFDGVDDGVEASNPVMSLTTAGSLEAWVKPDLIRSGVQEIVINGDSSGYTWNIHMYLQDGKPSFSVFSDAYIQRWSVADTISAGEWHHLVGTFNGATQTGRIYIDGLLAGSWGGAGSNLITPCCEV